MNEIQKYWSVNVIAQSGRPGDTNPIAVLKVITMNGERPSDEDLLSAITQFGIKKGRVPVFQSVEIPDFKTPIKIGFANTTSRVWVVEAPFDSEAKR